MTWATITGAGVSTATKFFGDVLNKINNMLNGTDIVDTVSIHGNVTWTFKGSALRVRNPADTFSYLFTGDAITANRTITFPLLTGNDVAVTADFIQLLKNKKLEDSTTSIVDDADNTKAVKFQCVGITTANTRVLTIPDFDGTIATLAGTEIHSNKTLTAPKIVNGGFIADGNGNELFIFTTTVSAVNEVTYANAATGNPVTFTASGGDANVSVKFIPKGTGVIFGVRETFAYPLTDETALPTTGVKYTSEPWPYDFKITDVIAGLTTAGTGAVKPEFDILKEDSVNANTFTTIFTTRVTIDASEFTSTAAATPMVLSVTTIEKGRRIQLKIHALDSNSLMRGAKLAVVGYSTAV